MADFLYVLTLVAFFALMVAFVRVCERIVGKDDATGPDTVGAEPADDTDHTVAEEVPA